MKLFLYNDKKIKNFLPLTYLRKFSDLRVGFFKIIEYFKNLFPQAEIFEIDELPKNLEKGVYFLIRFLPKENLINWKENLIFKYQNQVVGYYQYNNKKERREINLDGFLLENLWDLVRCQIEFLPIWQTTVKRGGFRKNFSFKIYGKKELVFIHKKAKILGELILNVEKGPIIIEEAILKGFNYLEGPCYIDKNTIIDNAKIHPFTTIGENCRISGEIEASVFLDFTNKYHEGFIGHSYIGSWVNLGAYTTNSNLKNNYSSVKIKIKNKVYDTKMLKFGCIIGDHTKTAIGTLIPNGAIFGICVNIKKGGPCEKFYPSFYWDKNKKWEFEKLILTIKKVMARRNQNLDKDYLDRLRRIYESRRKPI